MTYKTVVEDDVEAADFGELPAFVQGYITCAFWLADPNPQSGEFHLDQELYEECDNALKQKLVTEPHNWMKEHYQLICEAYTSIPTKGTPYSSGPNEGITSEQLEQAGHDLYLTRNGHGSGFWDRGEHPAFAALTKAAKAIGEQELWFACTNSECKGDGDCEDCESGNGEYVI
jgi:hypothetical protein